MIMVPWGPGVVLLQRVQLLLHPLPALQAAPQPVGVDHMEVLAALRLPYLLGSCENRSCKRFGETLAHNNPFYV